MKKCFLLSVLFFVSLSACEDNVGYGSTFEEIEGEILDKSQVEIDMSACAIVADVTETMAEKARLYREASHKSGNERNGVYVYSTTVEKYQDAPKKLAARLALLGFSDIYLSPNKDRIANLDPWLKTFISTATKEYGLAIHAIRIADNSLYVKNSVDDEIGLIQTYNNSVRPEERFYGIAADLEPHTCKDSSKPSDLLYMWDSDKNYGVNGYNDKLLQLTLGLLQKAREILPKSLQLNEAIAYNFQIKNDEGVLSYGTVPQFLESCDWVVLMSYLDTKESIWAKSEPSLKAAEQMSNQKSQSVSICVKTAVNEIDNSASLQSKGWQYLLETAEYVTERGKDYITFRGFDIFTYEGIEIMWETAADPDQTGINE